MPRAKKIKTGQPSGFTPAIDPIEREKQMIGLADALAEKRLRDGSASNALVLHYIQLASSKTELEKEKLRHENMMLEAKMDAIKSTVRSEELYRKALDAMRRYSGHQDDEDYE